MTTELSASLGQESPEHLPQSGQVALMGRPLAIPAHDVAPNRNSRFDSDGGSLELEVIMIEYFRSLDAALLAFAETADLTEYLAHCERWNVGMADSARLTSASPPG